MFDLQLLYVVQTLLSLLVEIFGIVEHQVRDHGLSFYALMKILGRSQVLDVDLDAKFCDANNLRHIVRKRERMAL